MKIKEVYDRIGVSEARLPVLKHLSNNSDVLNLVEIWDGGPTEGHLFIQKDDGKYILYEIIYHFNSKTETVYKHILRNDNTIQSIVNEIADFCKIRYDGTLKFDFTEMMYDKIVCEFFV